MSDKTSEIFKALADSTRRKILLKLERGKRNVSELVGATKMSQPAISNHLRILRQADLVVRIRYGTEIFYSINKPAFKKIFKNYFRKFRGISR